MSQQPDQPDQPQQPEGGAPGSGGTPPPGQPQPPGQQPFQEPPTGSFGSPEAPQGVGGAAVPPPPSQPQYPSPDAPQVPPPPPGTPAAGYGGAGYPVAQQPTTSSDAVLSLVMGILSFFVCPLILAIIAIVYGNKAKAEIEASQGMLTGGGLATAGRILGWINIILGAIVLLLVVFFALAAAG